MSFRRFENDLLVFIPLEIGSARQSSVVSSSLNVTHNKIDFVCMGGASVRYFEIRSNYVHVVHLIYTYISTFVISNGIHDTTRFLMLSKAPLDFF